MFKEDENNIIIQSDLFPNLIDEKYIKAYGLFVASLNRLKAILDYDFILRDYTIAYDHTILKIDKKHLDNTGFSILTHESPDEEDLSGWVSFRFTYNLKGDLVYETSEDIMGLEAFQSHEDHEDRDAFNDYDDPYDEEY